MIYTYISNSYKYVGLKRVRMLATDITWQDIKKQNQTASEWLLYYSQRRQLDSKY
jgi:hypothetical protein